MREPKKGALLSHMVHTLQSQDSVISLTYFLPLGHVQTKQRDRLEAHIKDFGCVNTIATNDAVRLPRGTKEKERLVQMSRSERCISTWLFAELAVGRSFASEYSVPRKHFVSSRVAQSFILWWHISRENLRHRWLSCTACLAGSSENRSLW